MPAFRKEMKIKITDLGSEAIGVIV